MDAPSPASSALSPSHVAPRAARKVPPILDWLDAGTLRRVRRALRARPFRKEGRGAIAFVQTHISSVFLTPKFVFKFKRPLDVGFVDFRSLRARRHFCLAELRLNRRLAPDVYLGMVALRVGRDGRLTFGKGGRIIDYAVLMKRLPARRMLDAKLRARRIAPEEIDTLADVLARFHRRLRPSPRLAHYGDLATWTRNWRENFEETAAEVGVTHSAATHRTLEERVYGFLERNRAALQARVDGGFVRNCHGDLRCEHIYLAEQIRIIDCVEFSERYRCADVANDLSFLLMDLCAFGYPELAARLLRRYRERTGDRAMGPLIPFYACYRAYVRGKVLGMRLRDRNLDPAARRIVESRARSFFALAEAFARQFGPPVLLLVSGLMGSGKSTLADELAARTGMTVLVSDRIRKELAAVPQGLTRKRSGFGEGLYSAAWTERTYATLIDRARELLAGGVSVILDATFSRRKQRDQAFALARALGAEAFAVECIAPEEVTLARLIARECRGTSISDGRADLYPQQKAHFEPFAEIEPARHLIAHTERPAREVATEVLATPGLHIPEPLFTLPPGDPILPGGNAAR